MGGPRRAARNLHALGGDPHRAERERCRRSGAARGCDAGPQRFRRARLGRARPPVGDEPHRYFFRLYAADAPLGLGEGATAEEVHAALDGHILARGTLVGLFGR